MSVQVDTGIPGGNGIVEAIDGDTIRLRPDLRDTTEPWFYWHIRVRGCAGRRVTVQLGAEHCLTVRGAAVSSDGGWTWAWITGYDPDSRSCSHDCGEADEVHLSMAMPYTARNLERWLERHDGHPGLHRHELCRGRDDRPVPWLELGRRDGGERAQVVLTARHHCCEMMASYALEGLMEAVLGDDELGGQLRERCRFLVVPMVDLAGVEAGDQGKRRAPHDHNRDYYAEGIYPETRAVRELVGRSCDQRLRIALDLHCPWIRGEDTNQHLYLVGSAEPLNWGRQLRFARHLETVRRGPIPYRMERTLPYGQAWNTGANFAPGMTCARWMFASNPGAIMAATFEIPYADAEGVTVDASSARALGHDFARAIAAHTADR